METLSFRQIHLDFHTSEAIPGVGKDWDRGHFQEMLKLGHVSSVTVFSKCHHGWSYHPTQVPLGAMHPQLKFDLLTEMIEAAHVIGVKTPVYLSVGLDEKLARSHSDWLRRHPDGATAWSGWLQAGYHEFCLRSPYLEYMIMQVEEVTRNYQLDGMFLDIVGARECVCQSCLQALLERGEDPRDIGAVKRLGEETFFHYARRVNTAVHAIKPGIRIFHNSGHIPVGRREGLEINTHLELESLPTGGWGYDHFPLTARYAQGIGKEFLGMTGKFHTLWGEFGGYKHPNALRYEASLALLNGARMSVGDQMHPYGRLEKATYEMIGMAYQEVQAKEAWCRDVESLAEVAFLSHESVFGPAKQEGPTPTAGLVDAGVARVLQEEHFLYDVVDLQSDWTRYKVLILPDSIPMSPIILEKANNFLKAGGKVLATGSSGLDLQAGRFLLDLGVEYGGESPTNPCYFRPEFPLAHWTQAPFVIYSAMHVLLLRGGQALAQRQDAFFNRDLLHFCSHQHAPSKLVDAGPAMVETAQSVYLPFEAFRLYAEKGQTVLREILAHALQRLLPEPRLQSNLPTQGIQSAMRQASLGRTVLHFLYGSPVRRGQGIEVIEDLPPLKNISVRWNSGQPVKRVYLAPQQKEIPFWYKDGWVESIIEEMECHQMLVLE